MEVPVLAEGLESEDQLRLLAAEGCDEAQGYLWGRPVAQPEETLQVGARGRAA
nr:EAL domain-containing protein [Sphingomonas beigongshangi]